ncbi:hypothetical protein EUAN_08880 [Andreesenia angusta]|uniref:MazG nucleotide pyrophosphohydrolase domain protein n=1 Tax=Andreesenia angusta TaxID=39480 RepID=A0A1S1V9B6_9FIRM|nr:hypothetical protein [Andreesenia angusta]OHW63104.1 hypothetical protein EUAN_08880 [Andreesenia angusta]
MNNCEVYKLAMEKYGESHQMTVAVEELSELQKEVCKYQRGENSKQEMAEEIADVEIMLEQMKQHFGFGSLVELYKQGKVNRLKERMEL